MNPDMLIDAIEDFEPIEMAEAYELLQSCELQSTGCYNMNMSSPD